MILEQLEIILDLADVGYQECPWAWPEKSGFKHTREEAEKALDSGWAEARKREAEVKGGDESGQEDRDLR